MRAQAASKTVTITGAFSYTGKYAATLLLQQGYRVRTLTGHPGRANPFGQAVEVSALDFGRPDQLQRSLAGTSTLINTYWVRFPRGRTTFGVAVRNTRTLIEAAANAGVQRIVHVSIANPSKESPLAYYRGKAELEQAVIESGLSYTILRPTVIFGMEDVLINNIAWFIRHLPVFGIPGDGTYRIRPIYVEDLARLMAEAVETHENAVIDAAGPETYTFEELVDLIGRSVGRSVQTVHLPTTLAYFATLAIGWYLRDVVLTWEEYRGLMGNLLAPEGPASGNTRLSRWLADHGERVGVRYASELARHCVTTQTELTAG